jgi:predicted acyl esterase
VVWIRTPYGRKGIAPIANRFAKSGAHVVVEASRGTDGSGGRYEPFSVTTMDAAAVLNWLRTQAWFPGAIVSWGVSAIGYESWALTEIDVPEWRLAILQDAPSELRDGVVYPGGIFAGKVMLGSFLGGIEWQARHWRASLRGGCDRNIPRRQPTARASSMSISSASRTCSAPGTAFACR